MPSIDPAAHAPLQIEINRLDRIGQIMMKPYDVASRVELVLQAGYLFETFGVSLDAVLDETDGDAPDAALDEIERETPKLS